MPEPTPADAPTGPSTRRRVTRRALVLVVAALAVGTAAGCLPVTADNRPTIPVNQRNGELSPDLLRTVDGCVVNRQAANALRGLLAAAREARVPLYANSCYRDLAGQVAVREEWCAQGLCQNAARPGTSNHGWGKAIDFGTADGMTFEAPPYQWLKQQAFLYGWNHPDWAEPEGSAPEPWHWEWVGDGGVLYPGKTIGPQ
jgi:hypothetical protein